MSIFSTTFGGIWTKVIVLLVFILLIAFIVYLLIRSSQKGDPKPIKRGILIPWQSLYPTDVGPFAADGATQVFRPYIADVQSCTADMCAQYFGVIDYDPEYRKGSKRLIELSMPPKTPNYWEFQVLKYPSWELVYSIPMEHTSILGGRARPLQAGLYSITLRTAGTVSEQFPLSGDEGSSPPSDRQRKGGMRFLKGSTEPARTPQASGDIMGWHTTTINDEDRYIHANDLLQQIVPQMDGQGYGIKTSFKSQEMSTPSPHIHREHLTLDVGPKEALVLIHSGRDAMSTLVVGIDGQITYPQCKTGPIHHHLVTTSGKITIDEHIFGIHPTSQFLPIYAYIFEQR